MIDIAEVLYNGIAFDPKNWYTQRMQRLDEIPESVRSLFDHLEDNRVPYVLVGGIALLHYVPGRNTQDLDLILSVEDGRKIPGLKIVAENPHFAMADLNGLRVDLLLPSVALHQLILKKFSRLVASNGRKVRAATPEGIMLMKLYALPSLYRQMRMDKVGIYESDILNLVFQMRVDLAALLKVIAKFVGESDLAELRKIAEEIKQKLARGAARFGASEGADIVPPE